MNPRHLILLSPYRLPTESTLYLGDEEVAAFLNGHSVLWHPAALAGADGLPRVATPYDHEQPTAGHVYAVPDNPPLMLPDDWEDKAREAGAIVFRATMHREQTLRNLLDALAAGLSADDPGRALLELPGPRVAPFFGLALGSLVLEALFEAMSHENVLAVPEMWQEISSAVAAQTNPDPEAARVYLQAAADRQLAAREVVYPVTVHVVDLMLLDEERGKRETTSKPGDSPWPAAFSAGEPFNVIASAVLLERMNQDRPAMMSELREKVAADLAEVLGGPYQEREDPFLPLESQVWNLLHGQAVYQELLGREVRVFARKRFGFHHQLPLLLQSVGIAHALLVPFDEAVIPSHRSPVVSWPSHNGKQIDCFTPHPSAGRHSADILPSRPLSAPDHHAGPVRDAGAVASGSARLALLSGLARTVSIRARSGPMDDPVGLLQRGSHWRLQLSRFSRRVPRRLPRRTNDSERSG